ncbi:MAG: hypothetical protein EOO41_03175, partial [Methanobacteriota archaeon]
MEFRLPHLQREFAHAKRYAAEAGDESGARGRGVVVTELHELLRHGLRASAVEAGAPTMPTSSALHASRSFSQLLSSELARQRRLAPTILHAFIMAALYTLSDSVSALHLLCAGGSVPLDVSFAARGVGYASLPPLQPPLGGGDARAFGCSWLPECDETLAMSPALLSIMQTPAALSQGEAESPSLRTTKIASWSLPYGVGIRHGRDVLHGMRLIALSLHHIHRALLRGDHQYSDGGLAHNASGGKPHTPLVAVVERFEDVANVSRLACMQVYHLLFADQLVCASLAPQLSAHAT